MLRQLFHQILNSIYKVHQLVSGNIKFRSPCSSHSCCCSSFVIFTIENRALHNINQDSCLILISAVRIRILCRGNNKTSIIKELQSNREYDLSVKSISKRVKIESRTSSGWCWSAILFLNLQTRNAFWDCCCQMKRLLPNVRSLSNDNILVQCSNKLLSNEFLLLNILILSPNVLQSP